MNGYRVRPVKNFQEWEACFKAVEQPHLMQASAYGEAKKRAAHWHIKRLVFERCGTPVAICQVLEKRVAGLRVAARINRGPLFMNSAPTYEDKENVYRLLRKPWRFLVGGPLFIAPALAASEENYHLLAQLGFKDRKITGWCSSRIDLVPDENIIRGGFAPSWRNRLKSSLNFGLQLQASTSIEDVQWMVAKHEENMQEKNFPGPSNAFLSALHATQPCDFVVLKAVLDGSAVAGIVIVRYGLTAECFVGWFGPEGRKVNCGNFLYWNAILQMKKAGCRWIDVGGYSSPEKFGYFKQNMRGEEYQLIGEWMTY